MIIITGEVASLKNQKQLFLNKRTGKMFITSSQKSKQWVKDALWQLKGVPAITSYPAAITMIFYFKSKRKRDLDNVCSSVLDVLKTASVIEDDDWTHFPEIDLRFGGVEPKNPRVEIMIQLLN